MTEKEGAKYSSKEKRTGVPWDKILRQVASTGESTGIVEGRSGRSLRYVVLPDGIGISDPAEELPDFFMSSVMQPRNTIRFNLETRNFDGNPQLRHPDFSAREFVAFALKYFEGRGFNIANFQAEWIREHGNDNFNTFMEELKRSGDKVEAAKSTWSGKALGEHGFTEIGKRDVIITRNEHITATFHRPKAP